MRRYFIFVAAFLVLLTWGRWASGAETPQWEKTFNITNAQTITVYWDADHDGDDAGEEHPYRSWMISNIVETTDPVYCDLTSVSGTQNVAVNDGSRSTTFKVWAGTARIVNLSNGRSSISCICAAGQTCSSVSIRATEVR